MRLVSSVVFGLSLTLFAAVRPASAQDAQARFWDASISGDTAVLHKAVLDGAVVDSLDQRRSPNGRRALNWAAFNNRVDAIKLLLSLKAPIDGVNVTGFTALHHAAESGSLEAAKALLDAGANTMLAAANGMTAAEVARARGNDQIAALIEAAPKKVVK
ncbi:MAG TPA: ankyrin repeat domain-containing protein [Longimicrobiales bacterium]|nr:ankyrin repeat domain-containing protein [Longimicrobiales bacterium]